MAGVQFDEPPGIYGPCGGRIQRVQALNLLLGDVYGKGRIMKDGIVPTDLVRGCADSP